MIDHLLEEKIEDEELEDPGEINCGLVGLLRKLKLKIGKEKSFCCKIFKL